MKAVRWARPRIVAEIAFNASTLHIKPGDVLLATHKELEGRTKSGLARATARAAEAAANAREPLEVSTTAQLRDLPASAARIFAWDAENKPNVTNNTLVVTTEQLQQMRELCETPEEREYHRKMEDQTLP